MAQYYQLTSLEDICRLYPNLQIEGIDNVQYMVQDDKVIQYTDSQGQQVLATLDNSNLQLGQSSATSQQGVFVIETVETQPLESKEAGANTDSTQVVELEPSNAEACLYKEVGCGNDSIIGNKSPRILHMDQNKPQTINTPSQYVIDPIQANLVHLDSSKQQSHSLETNCFSHQQLNLLQSYSAKKVDVKELQQLTVRHLERNKMEYETIVGQLNTVNNEQLTASIVSSSQKSEREERDKQLIMPQGAGIKHNSFIIQNFGSNSEIPNQILVNQIKGVKNQETVIQNLQITSKEPKPFKPEQVENTHFIMQQLDWRKQQQVQYQTQHFIVPQGEKPKSKVVVQRLEMPHRMNSAPQLILQRFQTATSEQGTQLVIQQVGLNKDQNLLPYLVSTPLRNPAQVECLEGVNIGEDLKASQCKQRRFGFNDKEDENSKAEFTGDQGGPMKMNDGENKRQDKEKKSTCHDSESNPVQLAGGTINSRIHQQIQTVEMNQGQINIQLQNQPRRSFVQEGVLHHNHFHCPPQPSVKTSQYFNKGDEPVTSVLHVDNTKTRENLEEHRHVHVQQQGSQFNVVNKDNILKIKQKLCENSSFGTVSSDMSDSLQLCQTSFKQDKESPVAVSNQNKNECILRKVENRNCPGQFQSALRFQGPQLIQQIVRQDIIENNFSHSDEKTYQTVSVIPQNILVQQEPSIMLATIESPQKTQNSSDTILQKNPMKTHSNYSLLEQSTDRGDAMAFSGSQPQTISRAPNSMVISLEHPPGPAVNDVGRREMLVQTDGQNFVSESNTSQHERHSAMNVIGRGRGRTSAPIQRMMAPVSQGGRGVKAASVSQNEPINIQKELGSSGSHQVGQRIMTCQLTNISTSNNKNSNNNVPCSANGNSNSENIPTISTAVTTNTNNSNKNVSTGITSTAVINNYNHVNNTSSNNSCNMVENSDETRMLIILPNGEQKLVRIPNTQQIVNFSQLWQEVKLSPGSQISIVTNEQVDEKNNSGQLLIKSIALQNQDPKTSRDSGNANQIITNTNTIASVSTLSNPELISNLQQRPRGAIPRVLSPAGNNAVRCRTQCNVQRMPPPRLINHRLMVSPQHGHFQNQSIQTGSTFAVGTQVQSVKEIPKFIPGQAAICPFCGISSLDFNKCIRCRRKLPPNVKSQQIFTSKKKKPEKASLSSEENLDVANPDPGERGIETQSTENKEKITITEKKRQKTSPKKKKVADEPAEILILSSDEEDCTASKTEVTRDLPILSKEPVYGTMHLSAEEMANMAKGNNLVDDLMENVQPGAFTTLQCRSVRIGSYRTQPKERVLVSAKGVRLVVPSLKLDNVTLIIPSSEILKVLIHFGKHMPVVFIYATPKMGFYIRSQLGMENKSGPYYDPTAVQEETHKRLTFILEKMTEDNKIALHNMFIHSKLLDELSEKEANEILVRTAPIDEQPGISTRLVDTVRKIMIYPPPPEKGGIALNNQDYACLGEDQFLNDVIIDFYLKYLLLKVLTPEDRERTHVFSTFFYKRLTTKPKTLRKNDPENDPKLTPAEKRHMRVKGWTKQVNLFEKDFIIVPINEHSHWFLAIICFPGLTGPVKFADNSPVEPEPVLPKKSGNSVQIGNTTITHIVKPERNSINMEVDQGSDRDEAEGDQDDLHQSSDDEENEQTEEELNYNSTGVEIPLLGSNLQPSQVQSKESKFKSVRGKTCKEPIKQPCILIFDSLAGASRVRVVATLRDYLKIEFKKKMGQDREFSKDTIKGAVPKVPQQNNFTDCGLYVLQYVESFFQDPLHDFKLPLKYLQDWFPEEVVACKRQELAYLIRSLMEEQGIKVDEIGLPTLTFTNGSNMGEEQAKIEEEEDEDEDDMGNDEEEELDKGNVAVSEFDNEEEEDMDLGEEEDDEQEEEEVEDEEVYEEIELSELQKNVRFNSPSSSDVDAEGCQNARSYDCPVAYDVTGSDDEAFLSENSVNIQGSQKQDFREVQNTEDIKVKGRKTMIFDDVKVTQHRKNVPLTEYQDFESQITCTTIEKNLESLANESDMIISEGEEDETSVDVMNVKNAINNTDSVKTLQEKGLDIDETISRDKKALEVTNIINKLVSAKGITVRRRADCVDVKEVENEKIKVNCDTKSEEINENFASDQNKTNSVNIKRSFEALKSVRIPKKADRALLINKRPRIDEI